MENQKTRQEMIRDLQSPWQPPFKDLSIAEKRLLGEFNDRQLLQINNSKNDEEQINWSIDHRQWFLYDKRRFRIDPNYKEISVSNKPINDLRWVIINGAEPMKSDLWKDWLRLVNKQPEEPKREEPKAPPMPAPAPEPYQFKAGDVCTTPLGGIRIIVRESDAGVCSYNQNGYIQGRSQKDFENFQYKKIGELKDYLPKGIGDK